MTLNELVQQRREHRRLEGGSTCTVCREPHPCRTWRLARAEVLVAIRYGFAAARRGERL